jgi:hypothetical protein
VIVTTRKPAAYNRDVLFFELFPAVFAIVALIVGVMLFALNVRARNNPHEKEAPRSPSRPPVSPDAATDSPKSSGRPSMRA